MTDATLYQFYRVATLAEFAAATHIEVSVGGREVLVCRYAGEVYAVENRCSHQDKRLAGARIRNGQIICPVHGARFDLASGAACSRPATRPIATFPLREAGGFLEVGIPRDAPEPS